MTGEVTIFDRPNRLLGVPKDFFSSNPLLDRFERLLGTPLGLASIAREYENKDGELVVEYNLAGYEPEEISLKLDTATNDLIISAVSEKEDNKRSTRMTLGLSPYVKTEDLKTEYKNGILKIVVSRKENRKEEALVELPLNS